MSSDICKVFVYGVNLEFTKSTGNKNDVIDYGLISFAEMKNVLKDFSKVELIAFSLDDSKENTIPATINIKNNQEEFSFIANNGKLYSPLLDEDLSVDVAYKIITKEVEIDLLKKPLSKEFENSVVRMKDIKETANMLDGNSIDTNTLENQVSALVWKSKAWKDMKNIFLGIAIFFILFSPLMLIDKPDYESALILILLAIPFFIVAWFISKKGSTLFKIGFDWKTNTIWTKYADNFNWNKNANTILDFHLLENKEDISADASVVFVTQGGALGNSNELTWIIQASRKNNSDRTIAIFATKKEAMEVLHKAQELLRKFN